MSINYCAKCGKPVKRNFGVFTVLAVLLTCGLWLIALPLYKKVCIKCGCSYSPLEEDYSITRENWYKKPQVWVCVILLFIALGAITDSVEPKKTETPEQKKAREEENQRYSDEIDVRVYSKIFVEKMLKAPSTAKWPNNLDFKVGQKRNKKGKTLKDVWWAEGHVDAQNSFGAMIRQNWHVDLKKVNDSWVMIDVRFW